jgi:hypothetical protein
LQNKAKKSLFFNRIENSPVGQIQIFTRCPDFFVFKRPGFPNTILGCTKPFSSLTALWLLIYNPLRLENAQAPERDRQGVMELARQT